MIKLSSVYPSCFVEMRGLAFIYQIDILLIGWAGHTWLMGGLSVMLIGSVWRLLGVIATGKGLECDYALAISLINQCCGMMHPYGAVLSCIDRLLNKDWTVHIYPHLKEREQFCLVNLGIFYAQLETNFSWYWNLFKGLTSSIHMTTDWIPRHLC